MPNGVRLMDMADNSSSTGRLKTIAIIGGTGKEGSGLALRWAAAGYRVVIGSRSQEKAWQTALTLNQKLGVQHVQGYENDEAVRQAEICALTVTYTAHQLTLESLKEALQGRILVDATSRVDYRAPIPPQPPSAAEQAQAILGKAVRVVGAFQTIPARLLTRDIGQPMGADALICSDDIRAAEEVIQLAEAAGMNGIYAGSLSNSIIVEGITALLISMNNYYHVKDASLHTTGILQQGGK